MVQIQLVSSVLFRVFGLRAEYIQNMILVEYVPTLCRKSCALEDPHNFEIPSACYSRRVTVDAKSPA